MKARNETFSMTRGVGLLVGHILFDLISGPLPWTVFVRLF
jgi:hypothetical protein